MAGSLGARLRVVGTIVFHNYAYNFGLLDVIAAHPVTTVQTMGWQESKYFCI